MTHWTVVEFPGPGPFQTYYVAKVDDEGNHVSTHPIPFPYEREAARAADRLNLRDAGLLGEPVPRMTEDEVRTARLARIAELRGKRQEPRPGPRGFSHAGVWIDETHRLDPDQPAPDLDPEGNFG